MTDLRESLKSITTLSLLIHTGVLTTTIKSTCWLIAMRNRAYLMERQIVAKKKSEQEINRIMRSLK